MAFDPLTPLRFLHVAYQPRDWIAVFLKTSDASRVSQYVGPFVMFSEARWLTWLHAMNTHRFSVFVTVNAIRPGMRSRTKRAIAAIRHVFLDADADGPGVLRRIERRCDLPEPSYVIQSSPNRLHVLWRVTGFTKPEVERLQRHLACELGTDRAATPCSQLTRVPGFLNAKYSQPFRVSVDYRRVGLAYVPQDFPTPPSPAAKHARVPIPRSDGPADNSVLDRARRYLATIPPAIAGQHGDLHTFRVCCRLVRGFALSDTDALPLLATWNLRCEPPWLQRELIDKLDHARRYGREPIGGLLRKP
jgi:RepB DNA-primase N-terminal domain